MRIRELHLDRFGPFTDRRLTFDPARPLTVVHGANEAGKSSALAAVGDALFGIDHRSRWGFLHDYGAMRIGMTVEARDGRSLAFVRRKANKAALLDAAGEPLPDDALLPFLGGVDRAAFADAFGLDQEGLRTGARRLAAGEGALGEALLAAAPGLGRLVGLRRTLADEAAALFTDRRSAGKPFYAALDRHKEARRRLGELSVPAGALERAEHALAAARATLARLQEERRAARVEEKRHARLVAALPRLADLDRLDAEIAAIPDRPAVDAAFAARAAELARRALAAAAARDTLTRDRTAAAEARAALRPDDDVLAAAARIDRLAADRSRRLQADEDRAAAEDGLRAAVAGLERLARDLGFPDVDALAAARPTEPSLARLRRLLKEEADRTLRRAGLAAEADRIRDRIARLEDDRGRAPAIADPREAARLLAEAAALPAALDREAAALALLDRLDRRLAEAMARAGETADVDTLRARRWPDRAEIDAAIAEREAAERTGSEATRLAAEIAARLAQLEAEVAAEAEEASGRDGPAPTAAAVSAARAERDAAVAALASALFDGRDAPPVERHRLVRTVENAVVAADALADARLARLDEAVRAERRAAEIAEARRRFADRTAEAEAAAARLAAVDAAWNRRLAEIGLAPIPPARIGERRTGVGEILALADQRDAARDERDAAAMARTAAVALLAEAADLLGVAADAAEPRALLIRLRTAVDGRQEAWTAARERERAAATLAADLAAATAALSALDREAEAIAPERAAALAAAGLAPDLALAAAEAALDVWARVPAAEDQRRAALDRRARADAFAAAYDAEAAALAPLSWSGQSAPSPVTVRDGGPPTHWQNHREGGPPSFPVMVREGGPPTQLQNHRADGPPTPVADSRADGQPAPPADPHARSVDVVARLAARLEAERAAATSRRTLDQRLAELDARLAAADAERAEAAAGRAALRAAAGLPPLDPDAADHPDDPDLDRVVADAELRRRLVARRADESRALARDAGDEAELRAEAAGTDRDRLAAGLAELARRIESLDEAIGAATQAEARASDELETLARTEGAEGAAQEAENALAELGTVAVDWRVLQAASRLAGLVVEEYRRRHQSPVLAEAARLFAALTEGRYPALAADYDEDGRARLVALRDDGRRLAPDTLSEGTRDQLFLALRLATLLEHAARAEPLPFVGDDLFMTFDEARTAAGLRALADFGTRVQAILFTHHAHVADLARSELGARVDVIGL